MKAKKAIQMILSAAIIALGIYMLATNSYPTPPFLSGIGFLLTGILLWLPNCPICNALCKK